MSARPLLAVALPLTTPALADRPPTPRIGATPRPIETQARITVVYAIGG